MSKHTQGEWEVQQWVDDSFDIIINISEKRYRNICQVTGTDEEAKANAKLIAAAPQMLECLTTIVSFLKANGFGAHRVYKNYINDAQAAINKATT